MQEQISEVLYYFKGTLKYKLATLVIAWVVCIGGWLFVSAMPNKYTSEARVHVVTKTMISKISEGIVVPTDIRSVLLYMQQLIFTNENLEKIIRLSYPEKDIADEKARLVLVESLKKNIKVNAGSEDIFSVRFENNSPEVAKKVVQAVLSIFHELMKEGIIIGAAEAQNFLAKEIQELESRLKIAEKAKEEFARSNINRGIGGNSINDMQSVTKQLDDLNLELNGALSRKKALQEQLNEIRDSGEIWAVTNLNQPIAEEDETINAMNDRLKELRIKYTEDHPEIVSIKKRIEALRKSKKLEEKNHSSADDMLEKPEVIANSYIQKIKLDLNDVEATSADIESRVDELKQRKARIADDLEFRLKMETELQNMNRDYEVLKAQYAKLIEKREEASMTDKVDKQAQSINLNIVDAPNSPLMPTSPNRKLLFSAVFAGGIIIGFGAAFLLYFIRPAIMSASQIRQLIGLPILGSVSLKSSPELTAKNKMEFLKYGYASLGLVIIYAGLMTVEILEIKTLSLSHWL